MAYVRGNRGDYDRWASYGLRGWSYRRRAALFPAAETWEGGASDFRGGDGPLATRRSRYQDPLVDAYLQAGADAGYPLTDDYNGAAPGRLRPLQMTIRDGRRESAATAYLHPALRAAEPHGSRSGAGHARRLRRQRAPSASSIVRDGSSARPRAEREVIVRRRRHQLAAASDAVGHRRSGRARRARHRGASAPLPGVGQNLQDHSPALLIYGRREESPLMRNMRARPARAATGEGAFSLGTRLHDRSARRHHRLPQDRSGLEPMPDIQLLFIAGSLGGAVSAAVPRRSPTVSPAGSCCCGRKAAAASRCARPTRWRTRASARTSGDRRTTGRRCATGIALFRELAHQPPTASRSSRARSARAPDKTGRRHRSLHRAARRSPRIIPLGTCKMGADADPHGGGRSDSCASAASRVCASSTHRCCPISSAATSMRRRS